MRAPMLGYRAAFALFAFAALMLGGCVESTLVPSSDANLKPRDRQLLASNCRSLGFKLASDDGTSVDSTQPPSIRAANAKRAKAALYPNIGALMLPWFRSEERRVGKEC